MALWPENRQSRVQTSGSTSTTLSEATVTASATAHVKGSWAEIIAATAFAADQLMVWSGSAGTGLSAADTSMLLDIGVGAAGAETVLVPDIPRGHIPGGSGGSLILPIRVPAGSRIAARLQAVIGSDTFGAVISLHGRAGWLGAVPGARATTYGAVSATSSGTSLTDVGSANTKSAWTELTASSANPVQWLVPVIGGAPGDTVWIAGSMLVDIGVGAAGSEAVIAGNLPVGWNGTETVAQPGLPAIAANLPAGSRLCARFQKSNASSEPPTVAVIGID